MKREIKFNKQEKERKSKKIRINSVRSRGSSVSIVTRLWAG
jgi:hypothetical protein